MENQGPEIGAFGFIFRLLGVPSKFVHTLTQQINRT